MSTRGRLVMALAVPLCMLLLGTMAGSAQDRGGPIPRRADGKPDLTGRWRGFPADYPPGQMPATMILEEHPAGFAISAGPSLIIDPKDGIIPYQPWALAERNRRREPENGYEDPGAHCETGDLGLEGVRGVNATIWYADNGDIIIDQGGTTRVVDMHRTQHLPDAIHLWLGDQIGRWEGDTLAVDVANVRGARMAHGGDFYSANAHLVERWAMKDANNMQWTLTITDPTVFTRPWTLTSPAPLLRQRQTAPNFDGEGSCHEGNVDLAHMRSVYEKAHGDKAPWPAVEARGPASGSDSR